MNNEELIKKLREAFRAEADERLKTISSSLMALEKVLSLPDQQKPFIDVLFREAHSLKGASRVVNLEAVESISHSVEETLGALKRDETSLSPELFEELHNKIDSIKKILMDFEMGQTPVRGVA